MRKLVFLLAFFTLFQYTEAQRHGSSMNEIIRKAHRLDNLIDRVLEARSGRSGHHHSSQALYNFHNAAARFHRTIESQARNHRYRHSRAFQRDLRDLRRAYFQAKRELEYLSRRRSLERTIEGIHRLMSSLMEDYREERDHHDRGRHHHEYHNRRNGTFTPMALPLEEKNALKVPIHMLYWENLPQEKKKACRCNDSVDTLDSWVPAIYRQDSASSCCSILVL